MLRSRSFCILPLSLAILITAIHGQALQPDAASDRVQLKFNTEEAEAVLAILEKRESGTALTDSDWQHLFSTEPYIRLKKRGRHSPRLH